MGSTTLLARIPSHHPRACTFRRRIRTSGRRGIEDAGYYQLASAADAKAAEAIGKKLIPAAFETAKKGKPAAWSESGKPFFDARKQLRALIPLHMCNLDQRKRAFQSALTRAKKLGNLRRHLTPVAAAAATDVSCAVEARCGRRAAEPVSLRL